MLNMGKPALGIMSVRSPAKESDLVAKQTGCRPLWRGVYVSLGGSFELSRLTDARGIPFVTLQPQDLGAATTRQPHWTLASTVAGDHDDQLRAVANTIVEYGDLVVLRYAPEMNGSWSPWGVNVEGNTPAQYIAAWRHVVTLFRKAGASNVLWLWAPNIQRGAKVKGIAQFWPGKAWVELVGFTGYGVTGSDHGAESEAGTTYDPTMELLARYKKPVILAETGVDGADKGRWMTSLGPWLKAHRNVLGLLWTDMTPPDSTGDWRFNDTKANLAAFTRSVVPYMACGPKG
jgi:hypothetical protein